MNRLSEITLFSTGGTFNKIYDPLRGELLIDPEARALREIADKWLCTFEIRSLIHKDSLEMTQEDREELAEAIRRCTASKILVVHGTDTMDRTAAHLARTFSTTRQIVLTGAMIPFSIDPVEATANLSSALGWLQAADTPGIHIAMHGLIRPWNRIHKERQLGRFVENDK